MGKQAQKDGLASDRLCGVAMNPIDHPHGGGEGKTSGGRDPVSPWGTPTKGFKTRSNKGLISLLSEEELTRVENKYG